MRFIPFNRMTDAEQADHLRGVHGVGLLPAQRVRRAQLHDDLHGPLPWVWKSHTHDKPTLQRDAARLRRSLALWDDICPPTDTNLPIYMLASLAADLLEGEDLTDWPAARKFVEWVEDEMRDYR